MRILFLSRWYPYPPDNGSKIRVHGLLRGLCEHHEVTLISFCDPDQPRSAPVAPAPVETRVCAFREFQPGSRRALLGLLGSTPRFLLDTHSPEMEAAIGQAIATRRYDLVIASQLSMAAYHHAFGGVPAIFEEAEVGVYRPVPGVDAGPVARLRRSLTWAKHRRYLAGLLPRFTCCTVVSDVERQWLADVAPGYRAIHVVPNGVEVASSAPPARTPNTLIFTGSMRYAPNRDAMAWFIGEVLPAIRELIPDVRLTITGQPGPLPFPLPAGVTLSGHVADVRPLLGASAVAVAPIRAGGGTRLKILEAMAARTPVVATTKAAEGLDVVDGEHVIIADTPRSFAAAVRHLLREPAAAQAMAERAWRLWQAQYDSRAIAAAFLRLVDQAAGVAGRRNGATAAAPSAGARALGSL